VDSKSVNSQSVNSHPVDSHPLNSQSANANPNAIGAKTTAQQPHLSQFKHLMDTLPASDKPPA
jgi:hypothetical protein